jgi:formylglycine-generating enzyme required for sulfatase activity
MFDSNINITLFCPYRLFWKIIMAGFETSCRIWVALTIVTWSCETILAVNNGDIPVNTPASARRMIEDLSSTYGADYPRTSEFLARLDQIESRISQNDPVAKVDLDKLIRDASLANPLLDFDKLLVIRRTREANRILNSYTSDSIERTGWNNEISELSNLAGPVHVRTVYRHANESVMKHMILHFSGEKIMFSGVGKNKDWAILEVDTNGKNLNELTPADQPGIYWFDGCYLPESPYILGCSNASMQGLPCEDGGKPMVNLYRINPETMDVRQLTFEQDSDWHPQILQDGRVMYLRWEYTDTPHYFSRYLFSMNPDGTTQREYWGSGSYFPAAYCWAKPVPNHPSMVAGVASGHHAKSETGRLILIDPALGRKYPLRYAPKVKTWGPESTEINIHPAILPAEVTGCVQEIPGWNLDVVGNVYDNQGGAQKYTFQNPYPLSDKYILTSLKVDSREKWVLALVDVFDNMTVIYEDPKYHIFEPIPFVPRKTPPVIADRTIPGAESVIFCTDIYDGRGLGGIPRGTVKNLRVFSYHYGYINSGGHDKIGLDSGWDIKRILGTVPVEEDGSFSFRAPANTPISIQPLDKDGAALALMRSWMAAMPGETLSCNGCHENQNTATLNKMTLASRRAPDEIKPWFGPARPFAYMTEIQPTLNKYCLSCHNDTKKRASISFEKNDLENWEDDQSYMNLLPFTRKPGAESDLDMYNAMEWHVSTSPLIQMLRKGHHGVNLDEEAWRRFYTWIDLNAPHRGMWNNPTYEKRRLLLAKCYANLDDNPEEEYRARFASIQHKTIKPIEPAPEPETPADKLKAAGFPMDSATAKQLQAPSKPFTIDLPNGQKIEFVQIPAGQFVMGSQKGFADEAPRSVVTIKAPFHMSVTEITNAQYAAFDPKHDTRYLDENGKDHTIPGYIANHPDQPVTRISWQQALQFSKWLSKRTGRKVALPTESQWEWAARAGTQTPFFYGDENTDFSKWANLADASRQKTEVFSDGPSMIQRRITCDPGYPYPLRDDRFTDTYFIVDYVKQYQPNPWGLYDIIGNVCEWTRSSYRPYPYKQDGRNYLDPSDKKVARGGSWNDRPKTATSTVRFPYESYQKVYNVGLRVIIE